MIKIDSLRELRIQKIKYMTGWEPGNTKHGGYVKYEWVEFKNKDKTYRIFNFQGLMGIGVLGGGIVASAPVNDVELFWNLLIKRLDFKKPIKWNKPINYGQIDLERFLLVLVYNNLAYSKLWVVEELNRREGKYIHAKSVLESLISDAQEIIVSNYGLRISRKVDEYLTGKIGFISMVQNWINNGKGLPEWKYPDDIDLKVVEDLNKLVDKIFKQLSLLDRLTEELFETNNNNMMYFHNIEKTSNIHSKRVYRNGDWCEDMRDFYGNTHPEYGGVLTDLRRLPIGYAFWVKNGNYPAMIVFNEKGQRAIQTDYSKITLTDKHNAAYIRIDTTKEEE